MLRLEVVVDVDVVVGDVVDVVVVADVNETVGNVACVAGL